MTQPDKARLLARVTRSRKVRDARQVELHRAILAAVDGGCSLTELGEAMDISRQTARWHVNAARTAINRIEWPEGEKHDGPI